jgi:hypothetical protein
MNTRQGNNLRLVWATAIILMVGLVGTFWHTAKAAGTDVSPSATVATAITVTTDVEPDGGLWIPNGGVGPTDFNLNSADGSIVITVPGGMDNVGTGAAGQLTVAGTPNASFTIGSPVGFAESPGGEFRVIGLFVGNDTIADNTNILTTSVPGQIDAGGSDIIRVGFQGRWTIAAPAPGLYTATIPVVVNYN